MADVVRIRTTPHETQAEKITRLAARLNVRPHPYNFIIAYDGTHGEKYCLVDIMLAFLDKVNAHEQDKENPPPQAATNATLDFEARGDPTPSTLRAIGKDGDGT